MQILCGTSQRNKVDGALEACWEIFLDICKTAKTACHGGKLWLLALTALEMLQW